MGCEMAGEKHSIQKGNIQQLIARRSSTATLAHVIDILDMS